MSDIETTLAVLESFGERLRDHRYRLNLSQAEVGDMVGVTQRTIQVYERGAMTPSFGMLLRLLDWMVRSADDPPRPGQPADRRSRISAGAYSARRDR